jgi:hypothetical protein
MKKSRENNLSQSGLTRLTHHIRYEIKKKKLDLQKKSVTKEVRVK